VRDNGSNSLSFNTSFCQGACHSPNTELSFQKNFTLNSDYSRLKEVLMHLLSNSLKFTFFGHVKVGALVNEDRNFVEFSVADTGSGISDQQ